MNEAIKLIAKDIIWHQEHIKESGHSPDWEEGFLAGMYQAQTILQGMKEEMGGADLTEMHKE